MKPLKLSSLPKTWIFDLDGTIVKHNCHLEDKDKLLPGVKKFLSKISKKDFIIILTARSKKFRKQTEEFLKKKKIRYDLIIFDVPLGERILINDKKPSGLKTAYAINVNRDEGLQVDFVIQKQK
ncbi:MAG: hypothetical protein QXD62_02770 [Candidatus Woesearchaeota archaeon]